MSIISPLPFSLVNGQKADASQVMADLNQIVNDVNQNALNVADYSAPTVKVLQDIGRTTSGSITFPAKSVPLHILQHETSNHDMPIIGTTYYIEFGSGIQMNLNPPSALSINEISSIVGTLTDFSFYGSSASVQLTISSSDWGSSVVDTFIYYVTLP